MWRLQELITDALFFPTSVAGASAYDLVCCASWPRGTLSGFCRSQKRLCLRDQWQSRQFQQGAHQPVLMGLAHIQAHFIFMWSAQPHNSRSDKVTNRSLWSEGLCTLSRKWGVLVKVVRRAGAFTGEKEWNVKRVLPELESYQSTTRLCLHPQCPTKGTGTCCCRLSRRCPPRRGSSGRRGHTATRGKKAKTFVQLWLWMWTRRFRSVCEFQIYRFRPHVPSHNYSVEEKCLAQLLRVCSTSVSCNRYAFSAHSTAWQCHKYSWLIAWEFLSYKRATVFAWIVMNSGSSPSWRKWGRAVWRRCTPRSTDPPSVCRWWPRRQRSRCSQCRRNPGSRS